MSEWISVKDRLPKPGVVVLCWIDDKVSRGSLNRTQTIDDEGAVSKPVFSVDCYDYDSNARPSHWMPLPDPPTADATPTERTA